jgi:integrase/recombinase XerD
MFEKIIGDRLRGPKNSLFIEFAELLSQKGYAEQTTRRHIRKAEYLLYWMDQEGVDFSDLTTKFLEHRLEQSQYSSKVSTGRLSQSERVFLKFLRGKGLLTVSGESTIQEPILLVTFRQWMRQQRGSCDGTLYHYGLCIRALLARLGEDPGMYDAQSLRQFVLETSQQSGWAKTKTCTTALRMFLRFLISEGKCADTLDAAIPVLAHWRLSSLPRYLDPNDVERIISSCELCTPIGRRDRAILLLLARLGLRAGDIVQLRLSDINWIEADICVSGKGRSQTKLPLTQEVGNAIVDYLQAGRPQIDTDALFICHFSEPFTHLSP